MGYPFIWGTTTNMYGGAAAFTQPTSVKALWNMTAPIKEIAANWNTIHYIDSLGNMYGSGFNSMGEVGNGQEFVNKYTYPGFPGYGWDWIDYENPSGVPKQIGTGVHWKHLYTNNWYAFYEYAQDQNDSIYSWGRNKALDLGNGYSNTDEQYSYDAMDVLTPTMVHPLTAIYQTYNFKAPSISAGPKQTITGSSAVLTGTATAVTLTSTSASPSNGVMKVGYNIVGYNWTQVSGNSATITSPGSASTTVTGLTPGTYIFQLVATDNNTGTDMARDTVVVSGASGVPVASAGPNQTITLPANSVTLAGSGSETGGTIASYAWTQLSGPSTANIGSGNLATTTVGALVQGTYTFQLKVTDANGVTATATVQVTVNPAIVVPGPPSANAGSNQTITLPTNSVTLTGSGTETNGTIVSYAWTELSGPSTAGIGSAGSATTAVNTLIQGTYRFQLTVTDNSGVTATASVQVTVNPAVVVPGPPSANAGSDQMITLPTNNVTLTGSGSETNGTIISYAWTQVSGPSTAAIGSAGSATTTVTGLVQGTYQFQLTVKDNSGVTASDVVSVTVKPAVVVAGPPTVDAGANQTITLPTNNATLTGTASETNGTIVSYAWTQLSGPSTAAVGSAGSISTTVGGLLQGTYEFQLTVTDNSGVTASDVVYVTVKPAAVVPGPPSANAGSNQTITLPTNSVTLTGSGSETNGTIVSYAWTQVSGPSTAAIGSAGSATTTVSGLLQGTYEFQLTVTDNSGVTASDVVYVTVKPAVVVPGPPSANAGSNQTITLPTNSVTLTGSGSETNGTIVSYAWTQLSGPSAAAIGSAGSATTTVSGLVQGTYEFQLTVTDNSGVTASDAVYVTVKTPVVVPGAPTVDAGANQTIILPTNSASLTATASESGGTIVSFAWTQVSGPSTAAVGSAGSATTTVSGLVQGTYEFQVMVTDNSGVTASDVVYVTVKPAIVVAGPPSVNAGSNQTITLPTNSATLTGSGSESNGTIVLYAWTQVSGPSTAAIGSAGIATTTVSGLVQGTYEFQLTVTDNSGVTASDVVYVTVKPAIVVAGPPSANAGSNQTITLPTNSATLTGSGSESNGTIVSYAWTQVSGPSTAAIGSAGSATTTVSGLLQGTYEFQLTVTDNSGVTASDIVYVTVKPAAVVAGPPSADAGSNQTITLPTNSVTLTGSGSESNGTIVSYAWTQVSGPSTATIGTANSAATIVGSLVTGIYRFKLTVTDNSGVTASATVQVTVDAAIVTPGAPSANAGSDQTITLPTNSVTLTGSGSESNGTIVSYAWTQLNGPATSIISSPGNASTAVSGLIRGVYRFQLTVTDNSGVTASDVVTVTVNPTPVVTGPLSANAGPNQTITLPANSVTLNGYGTETNGTIVSYAWTQLSGPGTASISDPGNSQTGIFGMVAGVYSFQLTVTDALGMTATSTLSVTVNAHQPPVANAGPNRTVSQTSGVPLDGSGSYDTDGTIVSYSWIQLSGPGGVTIVNSNSVTPSLDGLMPGVYMFQLTVTDNYGASATATVTITVVTSNVGDSASNQPPVAIVGSDTTVYYPNGDTAILNGSASYAPGGTIASYSWTQVSGPSQVSITNNTAAVGMIAGMASGDYVFQLTVTSSNGDTASATMTVHVQSETRTSDVIQLYPNPVLLGQQVTITGSNGYTGEVKFLIFDMRGNNVKTIEMSKQAPYFTQTISVSGLARGVYVIWVQFYLNEKPQTFKLVVQ
jgi:hypothetical protein